MGMSDKIDLGVFVDCTPLFDDVEWEPKLVALRVAMGLQPPPLVPLIQKPIPLSGPAGGNAPFAEKIRAEPEASDQKPKLGEASSSMNAVKIESAAPAPAPAPATPQPEGDRKRKRGRPRSLDDGNIPPSWLPKGWIVKKKTRKTGASAGHVDKYYESPEGRIFRSRKEVEKYLRRKNAKVGKIQK